MGCFIPAIAQTCRDEETVARNRRNARNAWQYNLRFAVRMKLTPAETAQINERLQQLEYEPRKLGEFSNALRKRANQPLSEICRTFAVDQIGDVGRTTCTKPVRGVHDLLAWLDEGGRVLFTSIDVATGKKSQLFRVDAIFRHPGTLRACRPFIAGYHISARD